MLNLADAIGLHYFPTGPNASRRRSDGPRVIYDIRHVTTYAYEAGVLRGARCGWSESGDGSIDFPFGRDPARAGDRRCAARFFRTHTKHPDRNRAPIGGSISRSRVPVSRRRSTAQHLAVMDDIRDVASGPPVSAPFRRSLCLCERAGAGAGAGHRLSVASFPRAGILQVRPI